MSAATIAYTDSANLEAPRPHSGSVQAEEQFSFEQPLWVDSGGSRSILAWIADQPVGHVRELLPRNLTGIRHYLTGASDGSQDLAARSIHQVTEALERLMEEDAAAERLFGAALAI